MNSSSPPVDPLDQLVRHKTTGAVLLGGRTLRQVLADHELWLRGEGGEQAVFRDAAFPTGDYLGIFFLACEFRGCEYRGCRFRRCEYRNCEFRDCTFHDCAFRGCEFRGCEYRGCVFRVCTFPDLDIPVIQRIHQRIYEAASQPNALDMSSIHHPCGTKHCRGGWAVHLAGEAGYALERQVGWSLAAALIYLKSDPALDRIPDFYATNDEALEDMRRMAEQEEKREQEASHE